MTAEGQPRPRKFTALIDATTDSRFGYLLMKLREEAGPIATRDDGNGHLRGGYDLSRADLLRGLLAAADNSAAVREAAFEMVRRHYGVGL